MRKLFISAAFALAACAPAAGEPPSQTSAPVLPGPALPVGGSLSPAGFLTIRDAPPSPWPETVPEDRTGGEDEIGRFARANGLTRMQAEEQINGPPELRAEMDRIADRIRTQEAGNFVGFVMVRDPGVRMEAWFERDAAATLAKYTDNPLFVPREGGISQEEQGRLREIWLDRMQSGRVINSLATDTLSGKIEIGVAIPEAEFRALAAREGWELGPQYAFIFAPAQPPAFADPSIAGLVRVFAREDRAPGMRNTALFVGKITLSDGCFYAEGRDGVRRLAMFGYMAQLGRDEKGFLVVNRPGDSHGAQYRIGEEGAWGGPAGYSDDNPDIARLRAQCGDGEIMNVTEPVSNRLFGLPDPTWVSDYARAKRLSRQAAWDEIKACMAREEERDRTGRDARDRCVQQFN